MATRPGFIEQSATARRFSNEGAGPGRKRRQPPAERRLRGVRPQCRVRVRRTAEERMMSQWRLVEVMEEIREEEESSESENERQDRV